MSRVNDPVHPTMMDAGLTIREHFAAMAMQGFIATGKYADVHSYDMVSAGAMSIAKRAVICADALIAELAK
jgi:hypothetical protein